MTEGYVGVDRRSNPSTHFSMGPWWVLPALAWFVLAVFAGIAAASFFTDDTTLRTQTANTWANLAIAVVAYWYGSSAGKSRTDEALAATSIKANETIAAQSNALASSTPAITTTTTVDPGPPATATTTTEPARPGG